MQVLDLCYKIYIVAIRTVVSEFYANTEILNLKRFHNKKAWASSKIFLLHPRRTLGMRILPFNEILGFLLPFRNRTVWHPYYRLTIFGRLSAQSTYIYSVPQCTYVPLIRGMSPRRNWDSPTPSLASECAPPHGTLAHSPAGEGLGESLFRRLEKNPSTLPTLWLSDCINEV